jgi:taurine dehydrogenase large subunit
MTEVAIIGAGYTGLSAAFHLAARHGIEAVVLEANRAGWGCSGRNGSFVRPAIGRVPHGQWVGRWGLGTARAMFGEALLAVETVRSLIREGAIACDVQPDGWMKLAHRPDRVDGLRKEQALLREVFGFDVQFLSAENIAERHFNGGEAHAALRWPISFAMHPLKFAYGLLRMARGAGARVHGGSPVLAWEKVGAKHILRTPGGSLTARHVVVASNGYTLERLFPRFRATLLPVLSNIVVTQKLSAQEIEAGNFRTTDVLSDTRTLLYYFRRLPDDRIMLGGKGPVQPSPEAMARHRKQLLEVIKRKFPFMQGPRAEYFWGGWVALTRDSVPHVGRCADDPSIHYALGYIGSGVSFSVQAGCRMAEAIATGSLDQPPPVCAPLGRFPFAVFRRVGQWAMMRYHAARDG